MLLLIQIITGGNVEESKLTKAYMASTQCPCLGIK